MAEANRRGLTLIPLRADINDADPIDGRTFDLVSLAYASFPKTPDGRGLTNVLSAVKVGGTVLLVGHDLTPMMDAAPGEARPFDHRAYVQPADVAEILATSDDWEVLVNELRPGRAATFTPASTITSTTSSSALVAFADEAFPAREPVFQSSRAGFCLIETGWRV
ncbi:hypothetical protein [Ornithinimicrobium sp. INDO-MA30-4]|uniref:hypothetical protein n=1 Tax=Ornithinimicrobium sp. INDO-MA30-4 TaxID=2908651 RepID=UPI001F4345C5|nr:hypothetical protein [Ornithinimicrobium sp. INDO-MA30-4]UJH69990.1 hypothetical protein L0A91_12290 [Ornithinimicrobium sp. INDO-MA30-4]